MAISKFDTSKLERLHARGLTNAEIAIQMDEPSNRVRYNIRKLGLTSNRNYGTSGEPPEAFDETHSFCRKCNSIVLNTEFPYVTNRMDGRRLSYCRACRALQNRIARYSNPEVYWRDKENRIRLNKRGIITNLPAGYLHSIWENQVGMCFYTDVKLEISMGLGNMPLSPSVDRMDVTQGYEVDNVVICSNRANTMKSDATLAEMILWMPDWYSRIIEYREGKRSDERGTWGG